MENEKLLNQVRDLRKVNKENEQLHFLKQEAMAKEHAILKTQLDATLKGDLKGANDLQSAKYRAKVETLEAELSRLSHEKQATEMENRDHVSRLETQLAGMKSRLEKLSDADPEHLKKIQREHIEALEKYNAYIVELETKLEFAYANQEMLSDLKTQVAKLDSSNAELRQELEIMARSKSGSSIKRLPSDVRRINELERKLTSLENQLAKSKLSSVDISIMMEHQKPSISSSEYIKHLKQKVKSLEQDVDNIKTQHQKEINQQLEHVLELT